MGFSDACRGFRSVDLAQMRPEGFLSREQKKHADTINRIRNGSGWKPVTSCLVCGADDSTLEFERLGTPIHRCAKCDVRFVRRIAKNFDDVYGGAEFVERMKNSYLTNVRYRIERFAPERLDLIQEVGRIRRGRLLEVGCGIGWFLEAAKERGFEVEGQEYSQSLATFTAERLGSPIWTTDLSEIPASPGYDVIAMFDVIEHAEDPKRLLEECHRLLKPDGVVLIYTPHFDSLGFAVMREEQNLVTPEHVTYFTKPSMTTLAQLAGFKIAHFETRGIDIGDLKSFYEQKGELSVAAACAMLYDVLQPLVDRAEAGNHMRVILRK